MPTALQCQKSQELPLNLNVVFICTAYVIYHKSQKYALEFHYIGHKILLTAATQNWTLFDLLFFSESGKNHISRSSCWPFLKLVLMLEIFSFYWEKIAALFVSFQSLTFQREETNFITTAEGFMCRRQFWRVQKALCLQLKLKAQRNKFLTSSSGWYRWQKETNLRAERFSCGKLDLQIQ